MKRILAVLLALTMLVGMACVASAQSAVTVSVGAIDGEIGDIVQVPVSVSDGHYLVNGRIFVMYDPTVLELQEVCADEDNPYFEDVNTDILDSSFMWAFKVPQAGRANFVFATSKDSGNATGGVLYTLTFKLLATVDHSEIAVSVPEMRSNDGTGADTDAAVATVNGDVTVSPVDPTPALKGDVNGDGKVNIPDAVRLAYFVNGMVNLTKKQTVNADINDNGKVDLTDAVRLFYYVSGKLEL